MRWIFVFAVLMLTACASSPMFQGHPSAPSRQLGGETVGPSNGGPFTAKYSGSYTLSSCSSHSSGHFNFSGSGSGSFIHGSSESGSMTQSPFDCVWSGTATLTSMLHPSNQIVVSLSLNHISPNSPCNPMEEHVEFVVRGGTGRFRHATGRGTIAFSCSSGKYTDQWSGSITF